MASQYKDDSGVPEPPREGVGAVQNSQNQNEPDAASANLSAPQPAKPIFGRRPTLGDLIGWYAGSILQTQEQGFGQIINISSIGGLTVSPTAAVYCATRFAVSAISDGLRQESDKIRVTV